ncbi:hypothetical protein PR048_008843 [Dryococelus australis]|uniref:Uncharacterized protein n=1 Tax=Dryococelus australis TaxID=614101 RepID=A0ABQ9HZ46_9NEOP|nr:hypothetical protein PR048_008843 [Dryococelus australis]
MASPEKRRYSQPCSNNKDLCSTGEMKPLTRENRVHSPAGSLTDFRKWESLLDDATGRRVFSGISRFPRPCIPVLHHYHLILPSSALKPRWEGACNWEVQGVRECSWYTPGLAWCRYCGRRKHDARAAATTRCGRAGKLACAASTPTPLKTTASVQLDTQRLFMWLRNWPSSLNLAVRYCKTPLAGRDNKNNTSFLLEPLSRTAFRISDVAVLPW